MSFFPRFSPALGSSLASQRPVSTAIIPWPPRRLATLPIPSILPRIDGYSSYLGHQMHRQAHKLKGGPHPVIRQCSGENDLKQKPSGIPPASPAKGSCQLADEGPNGPSSWLVSGSPGPDAQIEASATAPKRALAAWWLTVRDPLVRFSNGLIKRCAVVKLQRTAPEEGKMSGAGRASAWEEKKKLDEQSG
ncbi:hypothetical protein CI102_14714 [Trichoderma harzianum]|nr:hypothetical protein CI102_14714 [Trichoderma harzianum]